MSSGYAHVDERSAQSFTRDSEVQVVNVDEGACRMLVIWCRRCWICCGLGGCESYVEFVFPFQLRLEVKVECEFEVKSGKHEFK